MAFKLIGIDPGLADTGIGIVSGNGRKVADYAYGVVHTDRNETIPRRLEKIYSRLHGLFIDEKPDLIVVEDVFSLEQYPKSGITLGKVCGVILLAAEQTATHVKEIPVREAKQVLTGNGNAGKKQLEEAVRRTLGCPEPIRPFHASDALGLAIIGLFRYAFSNL
ncbi:MAG: crossover junction endodeoxyribonuclease RuvC [Desulfobacteraceae bacterium]|jgi:crossover junction endodeoxyribonuclease RuvC